METAPTASLPDADVLAAVTRLAQCERTATASLVAALAELDARRLYLGEGYPSLFAYCTQRLHYSEHAAYHRIEAARAARRFPLILERLEEGALTLTAVGLLRPHLTEENHREVLDAARHQGKRAVEELVARLSARPDVRASVRQLPAPRPSALERTTDTRVADGTGGLGGAGEVLLPSPAARAGEPPVGAPTPASVPPLPRPSLVRALAPSRYQVQMTVSAETHAKLRHAQDLLRHVIPNGDPAAVFDRALTLLIANLERTKWAATKRTGDRKLTEAPCEASMAAATDLEPDAPAGNDPHLHRAAQQEAPSTTAAGRETARAGSRPLTQTATRRAPTTGSSKRSGRSRHIPAAVKRAVWARDGGQCTFTGPAGRCPERGFLEFHHRQPFAEGGETTVANVALACHRHNQWEAERFLAAVAAITEPTRSGPS